uniref:Uncharacterized protein n=1 Tax=Arundo donax TaxID=35708 RepID=A0A0A8YKA0_ARUDO
MNFSPIMLCTCKNKISTALRYGMTCKLECRGNIYSLVQTRPKLTLGSFSLHSEV